MLITKAFMVISSIYQDDVLAQSLGGAHSDRMYMCTFIGVSVRMHEHLRLYCV